MEDIVAVGGIWLVVIAPLLAFLLAVLLVYLTVILLRRMGRAGRGMLSVVRRK